MSDSEYDVFPELSFTEETLKETSSWNYNEPHVKNTLRERGLCQDCEKPYNNKYPRCYSCNIKYKQDMIPCPNCGRNYPGKFDKCYDCNHSK